MSGRRFSAGDVLADKYRLVSELGRGGMGTVWRAEHLLLRSPVAVKLIQSNGEHTEALAQRFLHEARAAAALRSPHVVQTLDFGLHAGTPFIVMELLEGESLRERLSRVGRLPAADVARLVSHVARALSRAHDVDIVHRDLKPDNVFIVRNADEEIAKVLDFGIAKSLVPAEGTDWATRTGAVLGTPHYMSPEQARGTRAVDHRTDLWALGVIAFECVTGRRPFESTALADLLLQICSEPPPVPSSLAPVPAGFDAWFSRATERDPDRRFQSASELAEALRWLSGYPSASLAPPICARPTTAIGPAPASWSTMEAGAHSLPQPSIAARPASGLARGTLWGWAAGMAALGLVLIGAAGMALLLWQRSTPAPAPPAAGPAAHELEDAGADAAREKSPKLAAKEAKPSSTGALGSADAGDWKADVAKAQSDAKKAQAEAKKAQEEAAKARAAAEAAKKAAGAQ